MGSTIETVYPREVLETCMKAQNGDPSLIARMSHRSEWALWPSGHPTAQRMRDGKDWEAIWEQEGVSLFRELLSKVVD